MLVDARPQPMVQQVAERAAVIAGFEVARDLVPRVLDQEAVDPVRSHAPRHVEVEQRGDAAPPNRGPAARFEAPLLEACGRSERRGRRGWSRCGIQHDWSGGGDRLGHLCLLRHVGLPCDDEEEVEHIERAEADHRVHVHAAGHTAHVLQHERHICPTLERDHLTEGHPRLQDGVKAQSARVRVLAVP